MRDYFLRDHPKTPKPKKGHLKGRRLSYSLQIMLNYADDRHLVNILKELFLEKKYFLKK